MLAVLTTEAAPAPDLRVSAPLAQARDESLLPAHVFIETLHAPFGDGWGGETYLYVESEVADFE